LSLPLAKRTTPLSKGGRSPGTIHAARPRDYPVGGSDDDNPQEHLLERQVRAGGRLLAGVRIGNTDDREAVGRVHGEFSAGGRPATMVAVKAPARPDRLVEIEADAIVEG
jgi:hypothetical protein